MKRSPLLLAASLALSTLVHAAPAPLPEATAAHLPRWRGFNLTEKFILGADNKPFAEEDFQIISELGFNFARRYKGIPNRRLSFDLMNEPGKIAPETYRAVVQKLVEAIRREDPERLIIADGLMWGREPVPELADLGVAQATRGYEPMALSHYRAEWMHGVPSLARPLWPMPKVSSVVKQAYPPKEPPKEIVVEGPFPSATALRVEVTKVSPPCELTVVADGKPLVTQAWAAKLEKPEVLETEIPAGTQSFKVHANTGWALASAIALRSNAGGGGEFQLAPWENWKIQAVPVRFDPGDPARPFKAAENFDRAWLQSEAIAPWKALEARGVGVMVGEFGVYNKTPHAATLAFMEDALCNWREAGWGWALWNLSGPFGILDSQRSDVVYESYKGHKLDRKMLELLQRY